MSKKEVKNPVLSVKPVHIPPQPNVLAVLTPYKWQIGLLVLLSVISNAFTLVVPKLISDGITAYSNNTFVIEPLLIQFAAVSIGIFVFVYLQSIMQTYASELVAKDLRRDLTNHISKQGYAYIQTMTPSVLLTNLTSDADAIKGFVSQAIPSIVASVFLIVGSSVLLLMTNWRLALVVLTIIPIIAFSFAFVLKKVGVLFGKAQSTIDWLNKVINESILGAALIRVLNSQLEESKKFTAANQNARDIGLQILNHFAVLIPIITIVANLTTLPILLLGGRFVMNGTMSIGDIVAFNSYVGILIFPIILIGFMSNVMARSAASYTRIVTALATEEKEVSGTVPAKIEKNIELENIELSHGEKTILKDISVIIKGGKQTAIIGPTAAGKTQLLYLLSGLQKPTQGSIIYSGTHIDEFDTDSFYKKLGIVFQDSSIFNMSIRENIAFNTDVTEQNLTKAIETAELSAFVLSLPQGLDTIVSERGGSLSGGQKQRLMLARALALNPTVLLLDDFTARVDNQTEQKILTNITKNYPGITLISVTQKISSVKNYDQIILLMEGEIIAAGKHEALLETSPEYVQLYESQKSTNAYELQPE